MTELERYLEKIDADLAKETKKMDRLEEKINTLRSIRSDVLDLVMNERNKINGDK